MLFARHCSEVTCVGFISIVPYLCFMAQFSVFTKQFMIILYLLQFSRIYLVLLDNVKIKNILNVLGFISCIMSLQHDLPKYSNQ